MKSHHWSQEPVYTIFFPETLKKENSIICYMKRFERDSVLPQQTTPPLKDNEGKMTWSIFEDRLLLH